MENNALAQVAAELYGDGAWEIVSKLSEKEKTHRRQAQVGLASNVLGITAGGAALWGASKNPALKDPTPKNAGWTTSRGIKYIKSPAGQARLIRAGAAGAVGLQAANLGGDLVANRVLARSAKKKVEKRDEQKGTTPPKIKAAATAINTAPKVAPAVTTAADRTVNAATRTAETSLKSTAVGPTKSEIASGAGVAATGAVLGRGALKRADTALDRAQSTPDRGVAGPMARGAMDLKKLGKATAIGGAAAGTAIAGQGALRRAKQRRSVAKNYDFTLRGEISKADEKRQVFGWASVVEVNGEPVVDLQGDYLPVDVLENATYEYVIKSRKGGDMHKRNGSEPFHVSDLIESFVVTPEKKDLLGLPDEMPCGWWVGFKVSDDEVWNLVKEGKRPEFSIHGSGQRVEKNLES